MRTAQANLCSQGANLPLIQWAIVKEWQRLYGVSDRELAARIGYSPSQLCDVKRGHRTVSAAFIDCLAYELRMSYDDFLVHPRLQAPAEPRKKAQTIQRTDDRRIWPAPDPGKTLLSHRQAEEVERETARTLLRRPTRRVKDFP